MSYSLSDRAFKRAMNRRDFLWLMSASGVAVSATLAGCAVDAEGLAGLAKAFL